MRYVYGITTALLLGGTVATLTVGPVGAQTAQNEPGAIAATTPRPGAPMSFADLAAGWSRAMSLSPRSALVVIVNGCLVSTSSSTMERVTRQRSSIG